MRSADVLRSGAFRFALLLALVFAAGSALLLSTVERSIAHYALEATGGSLRTETAILASEWRDGGRAALRTAIDRHRRAGGDAPFLYILTDAQGRRLIDDLPAAAVTPGWSSVPVREHPDAPAEAFRALGIRLPDGAMLMVATDTYDVQDLRRRLDTLTIGGGICVTLIALVGGYVVGGVFMRRLDRVNRSVLRIMAGRLDERLPTIGISAEFDALSANLNRMLARIESLMDGLRQVSTDIAHDLRTPLTRLHQHLETLRTDAGHTEAGEAIDAAIVQVDSILAIFRALLRIGSLEGGLGREHFQPVDIAAVMDRVCLAYQGAAEDAGRSLAWDHGAPLIVAGDAQLLAQIFANLIENALHHTPPGTAITSTLARHADGIVATVADTGPGIPPADRPRVTDRFYRLDRSRHTPGAGLGLALVAAIAHWHGGRIALEDNAPGLRAMLILPLADIAAA